MRFAKLNTDQNTISYSRHLVLFFFLGIMISNCTAVLAPPYNESLVSDLNENLLTTLQYFNTVEDGSINPANPVMMKTLTDLISMYESYEIRGSARAIPEGAALDKMNNWLNKRGLQPIGDEIPSVIAIREIKETFIKLKSTIQNQGVTSAELTAFKNQILIYYDQALTYESHLKR